MSIKNPKSLNSNGMSTLNLHSVILNSQYYFFVQSLINYKLHHLLRYITFFTYINYIKLLILFYMHLHVPQLEPQIQFNISRQHVEVAVR